jgi:hypothetical protein
VEITAALAEQLHALSDDPAAGDRLTAGLSALGQDVLDAVPSCLTVTLLFERFGATVPVSLVTTTTDLPAFASLAVPLAVQDQRAAATLILRAGQTGAFLLLADDLRRRLGADRPSVQLDRHLTVASVDAREPLATSLAELSAVNQGLGVLIAQGLPPEEARWELRRRASAAGVTLAVAARTLFS